MNTLDSDSFNTAGQTVSYEFEVKVAGNYKIAANYRQSEKTDFPVFCDVAIDGKFQILLSKTTAWHIQQNIRQLQCRIQRVKT